MTGTGSATFGPLPDVAAVWPDLAAKEAVPLGAGSDARAWRLGDWVVKQPLHPKAADALLREARVLDVVRGNVALAVPAVQVHPGPPVLSRHPMLMGEHLSPSVYDGLDPSQQLALAHDLARFHADCHGLSAPALRAAGAVSVADWPAPDTAKPAIAMLPDPAQTIARRLLALWSDLSPDPLGQVWGHFDAHGWNMAFDAQTRQLVGIYDFGDSGFGDLHRDLVYSALISLDLTRRTAVAYAERTGRDVNLRRLDILAGAHRLWELSKSNDGDRGFLIAAFLRWAEFSTI